MNKRQALRGWTLQDQALTSRQIEEALSGCGRRGTNVEDLIGAQTTKVSLSIFGRAIIELDGAKRPHLTPGGDMLAVFAAEMDHAAVWI